MASSKVMASSSPANQDQQQRISDHNNNNNLILMNMDDLLKNIYDAPMVGNSDPEMTLEDYLMKAGEEDVVANLVSAPPPVSEYSGVIDPTICSGGTAEQHMQFGNIGGRGKRKVVVEDPPVDKATQQKQRRMIKNRESAARSRERKQAYTVELESLVTQLEEEHARLLKQVDELNKERLKQLMENLMPVVEKKRPPRPFRRSKSM